MFLPGSLKLPSILLKVLGRYRDKFKNIDSDLYCNISNNQSLHIDDFSFDIFGTSHDASDSIGLLVSNKEKRLGVATDLGMLTSDIIETLKNPMLLFSKQIMIQGCY